MLTDDRTLNGAYYAGSQEITRKRQGKLNGDVLLLQNNTPAHTSQVAMAAATECEFKILSHPPYFLIWILLTSICSQTESPSSWYTVWKS